MSSPQLPPWLNSPPEPPAAHWRQPPPQPQSRIPRSWIVGGAAVAVLCALIIIAAASAGTSSRRSTSNSEPASLANTCVRSGYSGHYVKVRCYLNDGFSHSVYTMTPQEARVVAPRIVGDRPTRLR